MAKIVNLRQARKRKQRAQAEQEAAENRARFGRTPAEKQRIEAEEAEARRKLDQLKRDPDG
jgi:hypothetical protein